MMTGIIFTSCLRCSLYLWCGNKESGRMVSRNHIRILFMLSLKMQEAGTTTEFSTLKILSLTWGIIATWSDKNLDVMSAEKKKMSFTLFQQKLSTVLARSRIQVYVAVQLILEQNCGSREWTQYLRRKEENPSRLFEQYPSLSYSNKKWTHYSFSVLVSDNTITQCNAKWACRIWK